MNTTDKISCNDIPMLIMDKLFQMELEALEYSGEEPEAIENAVRAHERRNELCRGVMLTNLRGFIVVPGRGLKLILEKTTEGGVGTAAQIIKFPQFSNDAIEEEDDIITLSTVIASTLALFFPYSSSDLDLLISQVLFREWVENQPLSNLNLGDLQAGDEDSDQGRLIIRFNFETPDTPKPTLWIRVKGDLVNSVALNMALRARKTD